ncbi:MAG: MarR family transcriptional regulator [Jatrophihabitantaceae bacterium]
MNNAGSNHNSSTDAAAVLAGQAEIVDAVLGGQAEIVDAVLAASRVFVAVASNALVGTRPEVTLPQFRALVLLDQHGSMSLAHLASALGVVPSTATRMCDRLVAKKLVQRVTDRTNRRQLNITLLPTAKTLLAESTRRRKNEISRLLRSISRADQHALAGSLTMLVDAASARERAAAAKQARS